MLQSRSGNQMSRLSFHEVSRLFSLQARILSNSVSSVGQSRNSWNSVKTWAVVGSSTSSSFSSSMATLSLMAVGGREMTCLVMALGLMSRTVSKASWSWLEHRTEWPHSSGPRESSPETTTRVPETVRSSSGPHGNPAPAAEDHKWALMTQEVPCCGLGSRILMTLIQGMKGRGWVKVGGGRLVTWEALSELDLTLRLWWWQDQVFVYILYSPLLMKHFQFEVGC